MTDLQNLLFNKLSSASSNIEGIIDRNTLDTGYKRHIYHQIEPLLLDFLAPATNHSQWIIMTGVRGVGKTTLLAQLYQHPKLQTSDRFYLSFDDLHANNIQLEDIQVVMEHSLKTKLIDLKNPTFLFLDEVHFLNKWSTVIKVLFDNSRNLCLICTGSSAVSFWSNPDIGRRAKMISVPPLSFAESLAIDNIYLKTINSDQSRLTHILNTLNTDLGSVIKKGMFDSDNAQEVYQALLPIDTQLRNNTYMLNAYIDKYIHFYGTLPYSSLLKNNSSYYQVSGLTESDQAYKDARQKSELQIKERILQTFNSLFMKDLEILGSFDTQTKTKFLRLLLLLANSLDINLPKLSVNLGLNIATIQNMLKALQNGEIIIAIPPLGASLGKISKTYKYLFNGPALRLALSNLEISSTNPPDSAINNMRGRLLEDVIAMYLKRLFINQPILGILEYDSSQGGADFVVMPQGLKSTAVVIEAGYNKKSTSQVAQTLKKFPDRYGLVISNQPLKLDKANNVVTVPLYLFLLA